jgi:hypothetical protein
VVIAESASLTARLLLEPQELAVLRGCLPQGMREGDAPRALDEHVVAGLRARDVIDADGVVNRSVLAGLVLLADPAAVRLSVVAAGPAMVRRTSIALSDQLLAGLTVEEPSGRAEQFLARTRAVASELVRLLPALAMTSVPSRTGLRDVEPGLLLAAVERAQSTRGGGHEHDPELGTGADTARALADGLVGSLSVTLTLPAGAIADGPVLDRVLWVATAGGWWSLRPHTDRGGRARLDVAPVVPPELASELAPLLAAAALALGEMAWVEPASGGPQ